MLHSNDPAVTAALERANRDYLLPLSWPGVYGVLGLPEWLPYPRRSARREAERDMRASVGNLVRERRAQSGARIDLMTRLLTAKDPETGQTMGDEQMVDNLLTFLLAGHERLRNRWRGCCTSPRSPRHGSERMLCADRRGRR